MLALARETGVAAEPYPGSALPDRYPPCCFGERDDDVDRNFGELAGVLRMLG